MSVPSRRQAAPATAGTLVGNHPSVRAVLAAVRRLGPTHSTVLIHGESGTGKELVAEALHLASARASGPLVKVNCSALVESLLLSELFGHERGAFTGASARRRGRFERAHGGTLFLDEIGDISPRTQVALLRVLEERRIERVGGSASIPVDVRIVCATHRDLPALVAAGEFREDLYYRLAGFTIEVPSLRERLSDLPLLAEHLLARAAAERGLPAKRLTEDALALLARHRWPGNVRELDNALAAAALFADGPFIDAAALLEQVASLARVASEPVESPRSVIGFEEAALGSSLPASSADLVAVAYQRIRSEGASLGDLKRTLEQACISRALEETGGNITRAATLLGMKRPRLSQLVKQYELLGVSEEEAS